MGSEQLLELTFPGQLPELSRYPDAGSWQRQPAVYSNPVQKLLVVADHQKRAVIGAERVLQRLNRLDIEVIAWLVQQQQLARLAVSERAGQTCAQALPTTELANTLVRVVPTKKEAGEGGPAGVFSSFRVDARQGVAHRFIWIKQGEILVETRCRNMHGNRADLGFEITVNASQQCRLACTVSADERNPFRALDP